MVLFGATDGGVPLLVQKILDGIFAEQDRTLLKLLPIILSIFAVLRALFDFGQQYLSSKVGHLIVRDMRSEVNNHLLLLDPGFFVNNPSASIISRITSDVLLVRSLLTESVASVLRDSVRVVALLISAIYLDWKLALIAFVVFPIGVYPVTRVGKRLRKLSKRGQEGIGSISNLMQESISGNRVVKIFAREKFEKNRFNAANTDLTRTFIKSERFRAITGPVNEILASVGISAVILYGGSSVINGARTQGQFIAFLISVFLLYDPIKKLSRVSNSIQQALSGAERIFELLDIEPAVKEPSNPQPLSVRHDIVFDNVNFSYRAGGQHALRNINLTIPEGKKVAIVGFSGSGKSTLIDLLPRFIDPFDGEVRIGNISVSQVSIRDLRSKIAMVGQHTFLFNDSIRNNIAYGNDQASDSEIIDASKSAFAYDFIMQLPNKFDTVIGEAGLSLSGGERQRIAIARAILKKAPILILDEATASLDNRSEREVQRALDELVKGKTTLVIAHRLSTVQDADQIVVLHEGEIIERGTNEELLRNTDGAYSKLHKLQFSAASGTA